MIEVFHRPASLREALALKRKARAAAYLAGGTYVNSGDFEFAPSTVIALEGLGLDRVETRAGTIVLGACVTLQQLIDDRRVPAGLRAAASQVVPRNVRNAATIGGHLAAGLPQSDLVPMLAALEATVAISGSAAARSAGAAQYAARPAAGLVTRVEIPRPAASRRFACRNLRESANARSVVSVAVSFGLERGIVRAPVLAISGLGRATVRIAAVERWLDGKPLPDLDTIQQRVCAAVRPAESPVASVALRRHEAGSLVALGLHEAAAKGGRS